jgi:hypothetical protein
LGEADFFGAGDEGVVKELFELAASASVAVFSSVMSMRLPTM